MWWIVGKIRGEIGVSRRVLSQVVDDDVKQGNKQFRVRKVLEDGENCFQVWAILWVSERCKALLYAFREVWGNFEGETLEH